MALPIYPARSGGYYWQRVGGVAGAVLLLVTLYFVYQTVPCQRPSSLIFLAALWGIGPPLWSWFEFFYIFPRFSTSASFNDFKHGQQCSLAIWAPVAVALAAYSASDYFEPPEEGKTCIYVAKRG